MKLITGKTVSFKHSLAVKLIALLLFIVPHAYAQNSVLNTTIAVNKSKTSAKEIIDGLQKQSNITFSYSDNALENIVIEFKESQKLTIEQLLKQYFVPQGIDYKVLGNSIVLFAIAKPVEWFTLSGYIYDFSNSEIVIGASIFIPDLGIGTITNPYGFYSMKLPKGTYSIQVSSLGYEPRAVDINLLFHLKNSIRLHPMTYNVSEITVLSHNNSIFLESTLMNLVHLDVQSFQKLPGLFGENDALRNLAILPGIQTNELSTSSISVRGGGTNQTTFLMDEAELYNASHFGGFFSIFNPDVVNSVNVYKSDIPAQYGGALSSLIDIRLREGNSQRWQVKGGIGLISARASVEGPLKKDQSSMLLAFRRTYVDNIIKLFTTDPDLKSTQFYFYDANLKLNYKLNDNNRLFVSGYAGSDSYSQYSKTTSASYMASVRWNHVFNSHIFTNTNLIFSKNRMTQGTQEDKEKFYWLSEINHVKFKTDLSYFYSDAFKCSFGYDVGLYNIYPFSLLNQTENTLITRYESSLDQMLVNSLYYEQNNLINKTLGIDIGIRASHMLTYPFTDSLVGVSDMFFEPSVRFSYAFNSNQTIKAGFSQQVQPLHQLPVNMVGISISRWMPASKSFVPQKSRNYTFGYYIENFFGVKIVSEVYFRNMLNLIETMQDQRILYTDNPEDFVFNSTGKAYGFELLFSYGIKKFKGVLSYDYCKALWQNDELNLGNPYPASHTREHTLDISGVYQLTNHITASATWVYSSGIPYTAPTAKYVVNGNTYIQFDEDKINTQKLPPYHRLDLSVDIAAKKNDQRRWKNFLNISIYNVYWRKNPLGVAYFIPVNEGDVEVQQLNPGYFYLYQFVPSVSYRFEF